MAAILEKANPGEVIPSDLFNRMIDMLNAHEALLGGNAPIAIDSITPPALRVGEELKAFGNGLGSANLQEINVDGTNVPLGALKPGSSDAAMAFDVPPLLVPPAGKAVTLTVRNKGGATATATFYVLPAIVANLEASFNIKRTTVSPGGNLAASTAYEFTYSIETFSSLDETFLFDPKLIGAPAGWSAAVKGGATEILIPKSQPTPSTTPVIVVVTTGAAGGGTLSFGVRAKNYAGITGSSMGEPVTIGAAPGAPNLDVEFLSPTVTGSVQKFANGSLYVRTDANIANQKAVVSPLNVRLKTGGIYTIGVPVVSNGSWTVTVTNSPMSFDTTGTPNAIKGVIFTVAAQANAPDADLQIPIVGAGSLADGTFTCKLKLRPDPSNPNPL